MVGHQPIVPAQVPKPKALHVQRHLGIQSLPAALPELCAMPACWEVRCIWGIWG